MASEPRTDPRRWLLLMLRWGLPVVFAAGGIVLILLGHAHLSGVKQMPETQNVFVATHTDSGSVLTACGVGALIIALMIALIGWMVRLSMSSTDDRDREEAARAYFTRTGRWPGAGDPR